MPRGLQRRHDTWDLHFITFSCYQRRPFLQTSRAKQLFEEGLEKSRRRYGFSVLVERRFSAASTPPTDFWVCIPLRTQRNANPPPAAQPNASLKARSTWIQQSQTRDSVTRNLNWKGHFWQARYYDFNVYTAEKRIEKLRYMHRNPVKRGLVLRPEDWLWSSFEHCATGKEGIVEIESMWTARKRERAGITLKDLQAASLA